MLPHLTVASCMICLRSTYVFDRPTECLVEPDILLRTCRGYIQSHRGKQRDMERDTIA